jgi:hypothetical protein
MKREIITAKLPKQKRRADFLFHNGEFRHQVIKSEKIYSRKRLSKINSSNIDKID